MTTNVLTSAWPFTPLDKILGVNRYYTNDAGEKVENTDWFGVVTWGYTAENMAKILQKGDEIMVQGRLSPAAMKTRIR